MVRGQERRRRRVPRDRLRMLEIVQVMAAAAAEGGDEGESLPPAAGAAHPLLIVESLRRHVGLVDGLQRSDVDPHLHGGGDRQEIDLLGEPVEQGS